MFFFITFLYFFKFIIISFLLFIWYNFISDKVQMTNKSEIDIFYDRSKSSWDNNKKTKTETVSFEVKKLMFDSEHKNLLWFLYWNVKWMIKQILDSVKSDIEIIQSRLYDIRLSFASSYINKLDWIFSDIRHYLI